MLTYLHIVADDFADHLPIAERSRCTLHLSVLSRAGAINLESSTNSSKSHVETSVGRSLINPRNIVGLITDLCITPDFTGFGSETAPL